MGSVRLGEIGPGEFVGELSALLDFPVRTATVTTACRCRILYFDRAGFDPILRRRPILVSQLVRSLSRRCEALGGNLTTLIRRTGIERSRILESKGGFLADLDRYRELTGVLRDPTSSDRVQEALADLAGLRTRFEREAEALSSRGG